MASEVPGSTNYAGDLIFSVGCHSGLNVPDQGASHPLDWAQAFLGQGATFIGNTGYGYGDSDEVFYSERLMANFAKALGDWSEGPQTVGWALLQAKQRYYNTAQSFNNFDEKALEEMTLYGLPMLRVNLPRTSPVPVGSSQVVEMGQPDLAAADLSAQAGTTTHLLFPSLSYTPRSSITGTYYALSSGGEINAAAGYPVEPRFSQDIHGTGDYTLTIAHGALMLGGAFDDIPNLDPVIATIMTDTSVGHTEAPYPVPAWYPLLPGVITRFLSIDGVLHEQLVVVPGQFQATDLGAQTHGIQRLYHQLEYDVYHTPMDNPDFVAPGINAVTATLTSGYLNFVVQTTDDTGPVRRVVVLYRALHTNYWSRLELNWQPSSGLASGSVASPGGLVEYFVQSADQAGNVAVAFGGGGNAFQMDGGPNKTYLPLVRR